MMIDRYVVWTPEQIAGLRPLCTATYPPTSIVVHHTGGSSKYPAPPAFARALALEWNLPQYAPDGYVSDEDE